MSHAEPLTKAEQAWINKLKKVMKSCPSERLESYTIGDNDITFYDKNVYNEYVNELVDANDVCIDVHASGARLEIVYANFPIVSSAG